MSQHLAFHIAGVACLISMVGLSAWSLLDSLVPNWPRIIAAYRGNPVPPAASVAPHATRLPQLRAVEADAQPTLLNEALP